MLISVAPNVADGGAMFFEDLVDMFGKLFSAVFGKRWNRNANQTSVIRGIQTEVRSANGFFDRSDQGHVIGLDGDQSRVGSSQLCDLAYRCWCSVVIDLDIVEDRDRSPAGPDGREFFADIVDRLFHSFADLRNLVFDCHSSLE